MLHQPHTKGRKPQLRGAQSSVFDRGREGHRRCRRRTGDHIENFMLTL